MDINQQTASPHLKKRIFLESPITEASANATEITDIASFTESSCSRLLMHSLHTVNQTSSRIDLNSILHRGSLRNSNKSESSKNSSLELSNRNSIVSIGNNNVNTKLDQKTIPEPSSTFRNQLKLYHRFGGSIQNLTKSKMCGRKISASEMNINRVGSPNHIVGPDMSSYCPSVLYSKSRKNLSTNTIFKSSSSQNSSSSSINWKKYLSFNILKKKRVKSGRE